MAKLIAAVSDYIVRESFEMIKSGYSSGNRPTSLVTQISIEDVKFILASSNTDMDANAKLSILTILLNVTVNFHGCISGMLSV